MNVCISDLSVDQSALVDMGVEKVVKYLKDGANVYVASSSKSAVDTLEKSVRRIFPDLGINETVFITSDTPKEIRAEMATDMNDYCSNLRLLAVSPAVTAGNSCTLKGHFTRVVTFALNMGYEGPTVDATMQQAFRVRDIGEKGIMDFYVYDPKRLQTCGLPTDLTGIGNYLDVSLSWEEGRGVCSRPNVYESFGTEGVQQLGGAWTEQQLMHPPRGNEGRSGMCAATHQA
jgi:hypothetical protein